MPASATDRRLCHELDVLRALTPWTRSPPPQHDDQGTAETNPDFDHLLRGTVHDPTTRRMGGVAGQAGVFSTADDVALFAQALLDQPRRSPQQLPPQALDAAADDHAAAARDRAAAARPSSLRTAQTTTGIAQRGFGWDINSAYSRPRGSIFPTREVHQLRPHRLHRHQPLDRSHHDTYVILLANSVPPRGNPPISPLRGEVATEAAGAL